MQLGEIIANLFAALILICALVAMFVMANQPLWPHRDAKMVILLRPDTIATGAIRAPSHPRLPDEVDAGLIQPRPDQD